MGLYMDCPINITKKWKKENYLKESTAKQKCDQICDLGCTASLLKEMTCWNNIFNS